jgi:transposase
MDTRAFKVNERGSGDEQYPPGMMLALLIYCYATGIFSSRKIEAATYDHVAVMYICGMKAHPDFTRICAFRRENRAAFEGAFAKVLMMAREAEVMAKRIDISVDGTKIKANASKHKAVSYKRAGEMIAEVEREVAELTAKAEGADSTPLAAGLTVAAEITRREERKALLAAARKTMEQRYREAEKERQDSGKKGGGGVNLEDSQYNFTDPESRIMKAGNGKHFEQSYNAQAAVDTASMLIVGGYVSARCNDKKELEPVVAGVNRAIVAVRSVSADTGFYSEEAVRAVEDADGEGERHGPEVFCAVERSGHHRTVADLEKGRGPRGRIPEAATAKERMARKLKTQRGAAVYKKRKETVEPAFGVIKSVMGFRQFLLRGLVKVNVEWELVKAAYDFKKLHRLLYGILTPCCPVWGTAGG